MRLLALLALLSFFPFAAVAQTSPCDTSTQGVDTSNSGVDRPFGDRSQQQPPEVKDMQHKQIEARNKERQSSLKKDTDQLLQLASELKQSVDKTNEHVLSLDVIKKTQAVEKLAKSIREKMQANGYCDFPTGN